MIGQVVDRLCAQRIGGHAPDNDHKDDDDDEANGVEFVIDGGHLRARFAHARKYNTFRQAHRGAAHFRGCAPKYCGVLACGECHEINFTAENMQAR